MDIQGKDTFRADHSTESQLIASTAPASHASHVLPLCNVFAIPSLRWLRLLRTACNIFLLRSSLLLVFQNLVGLLQNKKERERKTRMVCAGCAYAGEGGEAGVQAPDGTARQRCRLSSLPRTPVGWCLGKCFQKMLLNNKPENTLDIPGNVYILRIMQSTSVIILFTLKPWSQCLAGLTPH